MNVTTKNHNGGSVAKPESLSAIILKNLSAGYDQTPNHRSWHTTKPDLLQYTSEQNSRHARDERKQNQTDQQYGHAVQFSTFSPGTSAKYFALFVTRTCPKASA